MPEVFCRPFADIFPVFDDVGISRYILDWHLCVAVTWLIPWQAVAPTICYHNPNQLFRVFHYIHTDRAFVYSRNSYKKKNNKQYLINFILT